MRSDKVVHLPGVGPEMPLDQKRLLLKKAREELPWVLEYAAYQAEIAFKKYKVLVAQGFSEQQAIELLKGTI